MDADMQDLVEARRKAEQLLKQLRRDQADLAAKQHPHLTPEQVEQGRRAVANAVASAERMLHALDSALQIRLDETAEQN